MKWIYFLSFFCFSAWAIDYGYLKKEEQKYFKNDSFEGNNQRERIDSNVKEINRLHGEIASLKTEIENMKKEIEDLKNKK
jgi:predicted RNase H-like nuclease (RuvC/YqgF family)